VEAVGKRSVFGRVSLAFSALAVTLPVVIVVGYFREGGPVDRQEGWGVLGMILGAFLLAALATGAAAVGGVVTGLVALVRGERSQLLAWFGLAVCGAILALFGLAIINSQGS
jgi:hypothetical protein